MSDKVMRIAEEMNRRTACEHYRLTLNEEREPSITGSKIGGRPYWPADKEYPLDKDGKPMLMLIQVNCAEAGLKAPLPEQGMLQWFISINPELMYGCRGNFDETGEGFRIAYHETIEGDSSCPNVPTHDTVDDMLTPVKREVAIDVVTETTAISVNDSHFNDLFFEVVKDLTGESHNGMMWYQYLENDDSLYLEQNMGMKAPRHQMLGFPAFEQEDARRNPSLHDTLLFQLDSQFSPIDRKELVMWGDMGNGFIFINRDDLAARDFSRPYYCWDCG